MAGVAVTKRGGFTYAQRNGGTIHAFTKRGRGDYATATFSEVHGWLPGAAFSTERDALRQIKRIAADPGCD